MNSKTINYLFIAVILIGATLFSLYRGNNTVAPRFETDSMTISGGEELHFTIDYDQIAQLELVDLTEIGEMISGEETRTCYWGTWEHEDWGQYTLCTVKKINTAILLTTQDQERYVFNFESDESTISLFDALVELAAEQENTENAA